MTAQNTATLSEAPVKLIRGFLAQDFADAALTALLAELPWERRISRMYGKDMPVPRMEVWVADYAYTYSHREYQPTSWTPMLVALKAKVEIAAHDKFNSVLVNRYENEKDSVGWHADNEPEMSQEHSIASLSLGATRSFEMRKDNGPIQRVDLEHGSLLVMRAGMQRNWTHQLLKLARLPIPPLGHMKSKALLGYTQRTQCW